MSGGNVITFHNFVAKPRQGDGRGPRGLPLTDRAVSTYSPPRILENLDRLDVLNGARGIINAVLISSIFWCCVIVGILAWRSA